ncbi:MAG: fibrillarin-like rRNA/tRNA 2'-O-methyltransferase [Candidatus Methanoperedens sp.]|nr:fibrillarin-like rRNA/tRNA 2'-O-methyltransferase [Candidatus Methanoperedens sp.]
MEKSDLIETGLDNSFIFISDSSKRLITKNLVPGIRVYDEKLINIENEEYRIWDPFRSKLAALVLKGSQISIQKHNSVLYLGAANGTTVSHVSDIVSEGVVFAVEFSPRAMKDLINVSTSRMNLVPILADAKNPKSYQNMVSEVDVIYQDVAQKDQAGIAIRNARMFLKNEGILVLMIKARSIDSTSNSRDVAFTEMKKLEGIFKIKELVNIGQYHSDHFAVVAQK